jgi:hypothetical protein
MRLHTEQTVIWLAIIFGTFVVLFIVYAFVLAVGRLQQVVRDKHKQLRAQLVYGVYGG